jgi:hypothetical protein
VSVIRVNFLPAFYYGDDAVLLTLDGDGVAKFNSALTCARQHGSSRLEHDGVTHEFRIEPDAADIELTPTYVHWRLDRDKVTEIAGYLSGLSDKGGPGHCYADLSAPAETLVVSRDEYVGVVYPWVSPPGSSTA